VYSVKPEFLCMSFDDGELVLIDENWTRNDSCNYIGLQMEESSSLLDKVSEFKKEVPETKEKGDESQNLSPESLSISPDVLNLCPVKEICQNKDPVEKPSTNLVVNDITMQFNSNISDSSSRESLEVIPQLNVVSEKATLPTDENIEYKPRCDFTI
jgi:hypothetical protein